MYRTAVPFGECTHVADKRVEGRPDKTLEIVAGIHRLLKEEKGTRGRREETGTASQNADRKRAALPSMH